MRFFYESIIAEQGRHFTGIAGPRGAGKTILLKQIALNHLDTFYLSLDTFRDNLFETVRVLHDSLKIRAFLLDEVHMHPTFEADLKKIYDFWDVRVIFTSSMALAMYQSAHDLSCRVLLKTLYPFSLREYILFKYDRPLGALTIDDIVEKRWDRSVMESGSFLGEYIRGGIMPFALHETSRCYVGGTSDHRDHWLDRDVRGSCPAYCGRFPVSERQTPNGGPTRRTGGVSFYG